MQIDYTRYEQPGLVEGEIKKVQEMKTHVVSDNTDALKQCIAKYDKGKVSRIFSGVLNDIAGYYQLHESNTASWVLRSKFSGLERSKIKELLESRIGSIKEGSIYLPERLYASRTHRITIEGGSVDVEEICRVHSNFILYRSSYNENSYYATIEFSQSATSWSKDFKLNVLENRIARTGNMELIKKMVANKRSSNKS